MHTHDVSIDNDRIRVVITSQVSGRNRSDTLPSPDSRGRARTLTHTHTHTHTQSHTITHIHNHTHTHTQTHKLTLTLPLSHTHTHASFKVMMQALERKTLAQEGTLKSNSDVITSLESKMEQARADLRTSLAESRSAKVETPHVTQLKHPLN